VTLAAELQTYQERRRFPDWQPEPPYSPYYEKSALATTIIKRMLAFTDLELAVGSWVEQALKKANLREAIPYIERNSSDESKHDRLLELLSSYVGGRTQDTVSASLVERWQQQETSFSLAYALEMGVFFSLLPALTEHGDMYAVKCSQWISDDEGVHVLTNRALAKALGERITAAHQTLVIETLAWVFQPLGQEEVRKICERALRRLKTGADSYMMQQSVPVTPAFFEQVDRRSIVY
jgi:hypothetical protein